MVLEHVKGPDFPTGGYLYGRGNLAQTYKTGRGRFMMRAKCGLEQITGGRQAIITTEIPYQVNKSNLIKRIAELVTEKIIDDISDVRDESDRDGMRIVIELKRGAQHEIVLNQLHKHTQMQESFSMIFLAVHNGQPKELGLPAAIHAFIDHRIDASFAAAPPSSSTRRASASTFCSATRLRSTTSTTSSRSSVSRRPAPTPARTSSSSSPTAPSTFAARSSRASS